METTVLAAIEMPDECNRGWFAQRGKEEDAFDGILQRGHMVSPSTALRCSLQEVQKAELEGQYLMAVRHPFLSLLP